jgi:valyl-tRNA synthetase
MSKSKGNVIDPLALIEEYGADALRFTLASQAVQGSDVKLSEQRIAGNRNFATKLWNAARFCELNGCTVDPAFDPKALTQPVNRWLVSELKKAQDRITAGIDGYRFNEAANDAYHFVWGTFCDWYVEFSKAALPGGDGAAKAETQATAAWALEEILRLLHPFMPFVTEELWQRTSTGRTNMLIVDSWPQHGDDVVDEVASGEIDWVIRMITAIRSVRSEMNVPPGAHIPLLLQGAAPESLDRLGRHKDLLLSLARLDSAEALSGELPAGSIQTVVDEATLVLPLADVIDVAQERQRLAKELDKVRGQIGQIGKKLANEKFTSRAPAHVVDAERERKADAEATGARLAAAIERLQGA